MRQIVVLFICFLLQKLVCGQILQFGTCPEVGTVRLFDVERFLGTWYEIERFPAWFEDRSTCAYKRVRACGRRIEFEHIFIRDDIQYFLHVNSTYNPGDEAVFEVEPNSIDPVGIPLLVVDTDYSNFAIVYGCRVNEELNIKYALGWLLSRTISLPPEILQEARRTLTSIPSTSPSYLEVVPQDPESCSYRWSAHINAVNSEVDD